MRAPRKIVGENVGRMIFHSTTKKGIEGRLGKIDQGNFKKALERRGLSGISNEDIAEVMSGKHKSGWSQGKMRRVVEALQDVDVARKARSASQMVLQAARDAQGERKDRMQGLARERRKEANAEAEAGESGPMSVLDRMRGAMGRANKKTIRTAPAAAEGNEQNQTPSLDRKKLKLQPKIKVPKKPSGDEENPYTGFQS